MEFATAYADQLDHGHRSALAAAVVELTDMLHDDLISLASDSTLKVADTNIGGYLRDSSASWYDAGSVRRFLVTLTSVGCKFTESHPSYPISTCRAEELALWIVIQIASDTLIERGVQPNFDDFAANIFEDDDREFLVPAVANARPSHWFNAFHGESQHPYITDARR